MTSAAIESAALKPTEFVPFAANSKKPSRYVLPVDAPYGNKLIPVVIIFKVLTAPTLNCIVPTLPFAVDPVPAIPVLIIIEPELPPLLVVPPDAFPPALVDIVIVPEFPAFRVVPITVAFAPVPVVTVIVPLPPVLIVD